MSLDTAVYFVLTLSILIFWQSYRMEKRLQAVHRRLGVMMSPEMHHAEFAEFATEREERKKSRKRDMIGIAIVAALAVGWYFLTH
jgi:hypothetical protein